jgi:hypothetical protein
MANRKPVSNVCFGAYSGRVAANFREAESERLLSSKAVIQIAENRVNRRAAFGHKRTLRPNSGVRFFGADHPARGGLCQKFASECFFAGNLRWPLLLQTNTGALIFSKLE